MKDIKTYDDNLKVVVEVDGGYKNLTIINIYVEDNKIILKTI